MNTRDARAYWNFGNFRSSLADCGYYAIVTFGAPAHGRIRSFYRNPSRAVDDARKVGGGTCTAPSHSGPAVPLFVLTTSWKSTWARRGVTTMPLGVAW